MSEPRLHGKVALITGAASGIGEETARLFAANGASIIIADIQAELGGRVAAAIRGNVCFHRCDVQDEKQVEETVAYTIERFGRLDILFSNAAIIGPLAGILELDIDEFDRTMATNVRGVAATIKHAGREMAARNIRGSVIVTTSVAGLVGGSGPVAYTASKHALVGLVRSACAELGSYGIRVNCISPFGLATPMTCNGYDLDAGEVEENICEMGNLKGMVLKTWHVAEAALFLASDESAYISGQNLAVDGGYTVVGHRRDDLKY